MASTITEVEKRKVLELVLWDRIKRPEDTACASFFLASGKASFMTGRTVHINGGESIF
jgi:NAD(P)-dependent dehydrogenase (short-subunit alcohol dehydrogenase family)